jgi:subtilisin-like proprotein convertase family protein/spore coat protein CotH
MKKILTLLFISSCIIGSAQSFSGNGGPIQNNGVETYFPCQVASLSPSNIDSVFGLQQVCINVSHPHVEELYIYLLSPSGMTVEISQGSSCSGQDYDSTCFNSGAASPITATVAPYKGTYRPIGNLGRFNNGQSAIGTWTLVVKDYLAFVNSGTLVSWSMDFGNNPGKPVFLSSTNLPIIIINTNGLVINDSKQTVNFSVIYNGPGQLNHPTDAKNNFDGKAVIHIRGNSTKDFEKKAFAIELRDNTNNKVDAPLLGMPAESDWEMIAEYQDKTLMRIPFTYQLARKMGKYAARTKNVEVIVNGEYRGVYALSEKIKRDPNRLDIRKLSNNDNSMPFISGGYILKIDRPEAPGWYSLLPGNSQNNTHFFYQYDEPKDSVITSQQKTYIQNCMNNFETVMNSANYKDPVNGYPKYIDVNSCVDVFLINEMSKNVDAYRLSAYIYKKDQSQGDKLFMGPVWDYDIAWHNCNYADTFDPWGWVYQLQDTAHPAPMWWTKFMQDSSFVNLVTCRWKSLRQNILSNNSMYAYIDSVANELSAAESRNFRQWPILGMYIFPNPQNQVNATYASEVADLKTWINNRTAWIDGTLQNASCKTVGINELEGSENTVEVYPNPSPGSTTFKINLAQASRVSLSITDGLGRLVSQVTEEDRPSGENKIVLNRNSLEDGIYFYHLKINDVTKAGKVIFR